MKAESAKKKDGGGFGGIKVDLGGGVGGLTDHLKDKAQQAVTDELTTHLTEKLAQSLFCPYRKRVDVVTIDVADPGYEPLDR